MSNIDKPIPCKLNHVGSNIQKARVAAGLTQTRLGEALGWNQPTVNVLENGGRKNILLSQLEKIAVELEIDVKLILTPPEHRPTPARPSGGLPSSLKVDSYRTGLGETREEFIDSVLARFYPNEYANDLKSAKELCITGTNLRRIISDGYLADIEDILSRDGVVKVLMHHPDYDACRYAMIQDRGPGSDLASYRKLVRDNLSAFCKVRKNAKNGQNLLIRTIDYMLAFGLDMINADDQSKGTIYVRFYPLPKMQETLEDRPILKLRPVDGQWYRFFRAQFERHWATKAEGGLAEEVPDN